MAIIICSLAIIARVLNALDNFNIIMLPENATNIVTGTANFSSLIVSILMFLGIILFMLISPSASTMEFNQDGLDYGYTFFTWFILILPIPYAIFSKLEIDFS